MPSSFICHAALVSVYLPTRNRETLTKPIRRLSSIVVNDGSSDETFDHLEALARRDPRVEVIHNASSLGASRSRNLAIQAARGELVQHWQIIERAGERFSCLFTQDVIENGTGEVRSSKPGTVEWRDLFFLKGGGPAKLLDAALGTH